MPTRKGKTRDVVAHGPARAVFTGGSGYYGYARWGAGGSLGILGTVVLLTLIVYLTGGFR